MSLVGRGSPSSSRTPKERCVTCWAIQNVVVVYPSKGLVSLLGRLIAVPRAGHSSVSHQRVGN